MNKAKKLLMAMMCMTAFICLSSCGDDSDTSTSGNGQPNTPEAAEAATISMSAPEVLNGVAYFRATVSNPKNHDISVGITYLYEGAQAANIEPTAEPGSGYMKIDLRETSAGVWEGSKELSSVRTIVRAYVRTHFASNNDVTKYSDIYYIDKREGGSNTDFSKYSLSDVNFSNTTSTSITLDAQLLGITGQESQADFVGSNCGFCYNEGSAAPTINDRTVDCTEYTFANRGALHAVIDGLKPSTTYAVAAYVKFPNGTIIYSNWRNFNTDGNGSGGGGGAGEKTEGFGYEVTGTTSTTITLHLEAVINDNNFPTEGAICYSATETTPTAENSPAIDVMGEMMKGDGKANIVLTDLQPGTTYYIRPFWVRSGKMEYFETKTATTQK